LNAKAIWAFNGILRRAGRNITESVLISGMGLPRISLSSKILLQARIFQSESRSTSGRAGFAVGQRQKSERTQEAETGRLV
jgi:hypothetical protein